MANALEQPRHGGNASPPPIEGLDKKDFLADKRTLQAVIMRLIIFGEAATNVMDLYAEFAEALRSAVAQYVRNANRIAHGYFQINHGMEHGADGAAGVVDATASLFAMAQPVKPEKLGGTR